MSPESWKEGIIFHDDNFCNDKNSQGQKRRFKALKHVEIEGHILDVTFRGDVDYELTFNWKPSEWIHMHPPAPVPVQSDMLNVSFRSDLVHVPNVFWKPSEIFHMSPHVVI